MHRGLRKWSKAIKFENLALDVFPLRIQSIKKVMASTAKRAMNKENPITRNGVAESLGLAKMFTEGGKAIGIQK